MPPSASWLKILSIPFSQIKRTYQSSGTYLENVKRAYRKANWEAFRRVTIASSYETYRAVFADGTMPNGKFNEAEIVRGNLTAADREFFKQGGAFDNAVRSVLALNATERRYFIRFVLSKGNESLKRLELVTFEAPITDSEDHLNNTVSSDYLKNKHTKEMLWHAGFENGFSEEPYFLNTFFAG